jgi:N-acetylglucosaminyldiphosphoundecaprenol N-acetyl-beta-D-mannosaminyltransferase
MADGRRLGLRHFLFGSTTDVLARLSERLAVTVPDVEIAGSYSPPPGSEDSAQALAAIRATEPDVVWVALGAPRQELWMLRNAGRVGALMLGVGAAFDFHAGTKQRAPVWMQELGLEWLHRFVSEPRRLGPRYLKTNTAFLFLALQELHAHRAHARMGT